MNHKRLPKFEDCETIERLTGGDYLAVRNLIAYSSTEKGIILKDLSNGFPAVEKVNAAPFFLPTEPDFCFCRSRAVNSVL